MMTRTLFSVAIAALSALTMMPPSEDQSNDTFELPPAQQQAETPPAPQYQEPSPESQAVAQLEQILTAVKDSNSKTNEALGGVKALAATIEEVSKRVDEQMLTKDDVVQLVNATFNEKAASVKAQLGEECKCDCDCDTKLAEVTQQLEELKRRVAQLEAAKTAATAGEIRPGLTEQEVVNRLRAMGYNSHTAGTPQPAQAMTMVDQRPGHWTHPGDIASHLLNDHGVSPNGMTQEQMLALHDSLHEGTVAMPMAGNTRTQVQTRSRSVTRASTCPTGGCPNQTRSRFGFGW